ncbi:MAG: response regulator transcription factor [Gammaproteobacteria bacterium]|nr:response regulator transcription factor [Gammaproteobacteria bacterium]
MQAFLKPTVFIIDEDPAFKSGLSWQLESMGFLIKTFSFLETFFTFYREDIPGCLIIDVRSAGSLGVELITTLRKKGVRLSVIFLSNNPDTNTAVKAIKLGAIDFLSKTVDSTTLINSINQALHSNHAKRLFEEGLHHASTLYQQLTVREKEVFQYVLRGLTNKMMAGELGVTLKTIEAHRANIMSKMQATSLPGLVTMAVKYNLITEDETAFVAS